MEHTLKLLADTGYALAHFSLYLEKRAADDPDGVELLANMFMEATTNASSVEAAFLQALGAGGKLEPDQTAALVAMIRAAGSEAAA